MWFTCTLCHHWLWSQPCMRCLQSLIPCPELCQNCAEPQCVPAGFCLQPWLRRPAIDHYHAAYLALGQSHALLKQWKKQVTTSSAKKILPRQIQLKKAVDALVPIPQQLSRSWILGDNPAAVLAQHLASQLGLPVLPILCAERHRTQAKKNLENRQRSGKFFPLEERLIHSIQGKSLLLVDDFMSSGMTLENAAKTLKAHGAATIGAYVLGRRLHIRTLSTTAIRRGA